MMLACAAYDQFAALVRKKDLFPIKRSQFKDLVTPIIKSTELILMAGIRMPQRL